MKEGISQTAVLPGTDQIEAMQQETLKKLGLSIQPWSEEIVSQIYQQLEIPNWAPWLAANEASLFGRVKTFTEGQLVIIKDENPVASLSMNLIDWDGNPETLPSWDEVAGDPTDYSQTYNPSGNALVLMSMNVHPEFQGQQLPAKLITQTQLLAVKKGLQYIIGSFRPSEYGQAKVKLGHQLPFWYYSTKMKVERVDENGLLGPKGAIVQLPKDKWLRSLTWLGMVPIKEDRSAMVISVPLTDFKIYKSSYQPEKWQEVAPNTWECGEVGSWKVDDNSAVYTESNLWGLLSGITPVPVPTVPSGRYGVSTLVSKKPWPFRPGSLT